MSLYRVKMKSIFKLLNSKLLFKSLMFGLWSSILYFCCNAFLRISCEWSSMSLFYPNYQTHRAMYMFILLGILSRCAWQLHYFVIWLTKFCNNVPNIYPTQPSFAQNRVVELPTHANVKIIYGHVDIVVYKLSFTTF